MNLSWGVVRTGGRYVMTIIGSIIATLAGVGLMSQSDTATATQAIESIAKSLGIIATSSAALAGIATTTYMSIRGMLNSTSAGTIAAVKEIVKDPTDTQSKASLAAVVNEMPEVKGVITTNTPEGVAIAMAVPSPCVVPAGTDAAERIAKP